MITLNTVFHEKTIEMAGRGLCTVNNVALRPPIMLSFLVQIIIIYVQTVCILLDTE